MFAILIHFDTEDDTINHEIWACNVFRQTRHVYHICFCELSWDVLYVSHVVPFVLFGG